jgi:hypothetical protein
VGAGRRGWQARCRPGEPKEASATVFFVASSFLGQVLRRHPSDHGLWPGESLLTDVTVAVLNQVDKLATDVAEFLTDGARMVGRVDATSEESLEEGRRMDLVLRDEANQVVWVEVKDTAPESGDQLETYDRLRRHAQAAGSKVWLVYLVPLGAVGASVPAIKTRRWQELASFLNDWMAERADHLAPSERWLLRDYLTYLHERGLAMPDPLPPNIVSIVEQSWSLWAQLDALHTLLEDRVSALRWTPKEGRYWHRNGGNITVWPGEWWSAFEAEPADSYSTCDFDFTLSGLTPDTDRHPTFSAGLVWRPDRGPSPLSDPEWMDSIQEVGRSDRFGGFEVEEGGHHFHRQIRLTDLPTSSLVDQADVMLDLVRRSFEMLRANPPGHLIVLC